MPRQNTVTLNNSNKSKCTHELKHNREINELCVSEGSHYDHDSIKFVSELASDEGKAFLSALASNESVTSLNIDARFTNPESVCMLLGQLLVTKASSNDSSPMLIDRLKKFHYLSRIESKELSVALCQYLYTSPSLEKVNLYCPIHAEDVAVALSLSTSIKKLNLTLCPLYDTGAKILAKGILNNTSLTELNLANTGIEADGSVEIVRAVAAQGIVNRLSLHGSIIPTTHLKEIVDILIRNTTLKHLK